MQLHCRHCNRPFALKREEVIAALEVVHQEDLKHYNATCPHCGKHTIISTSELQRGAPGWNRPAPEN